MTDQYGNTLPSTIVLLPSNTPFTILVTVSHQIDDGDTIKNYPFCSLGQDLVLKQDLVPISNSTVNLNFTSFTYSYALAPVSPILTPSTLAVQVRDKRYATS